LLLDHLHIFNLTHENILSLDLNSLLIKEPINIYKYIIVYSFLILSDIGIAEDVDDSKRYATTCNQTLDQSTWPQFPNIL